MLSSLIVVLPHPLSDYLFLGFVMIAIIILLVTTVNDLTCLYVIHTVLQLLPKILINLQSETKTVFRNTISDALVVA